MSTFGPTPADLQAALYWLGLNDTAGADALRVSPRTLRGWRMGRDPIPAGVARDLDELREEADMEVARLVARLRDGATPCVFIYSADETMRRDDPDLGAHSARWWQQIAYQAVQQVDGAWLEFVDDGEE